MAAHISPMNKDNQREDPRGNVLVKNEHPIIVPGENQHYCCGVFIYRARVK
jgi:hypothetical protein